MPAPGVPAATGWRTAWFWFVFAVLAVLTGTLITTGVVLAYDAVLLLGGARLALALPLERLAELVGTLFVLVVVAATVYRLTDLRGGGIAAARLLHAERAVRRESNAATQRLLDTVEAMATAAHRPVPPVYVLPGVPGLNLALLGYRPEDTVLLLTERALGHWTRHELEGALGYAFAQWHRGDTRLHLRLVAPLFGLLFPARALAGLRGGAAPGTRLPAWRRAALGALWFVGGLPVQVGRLLQSAIVRDRVLGWDAHHSPWVPTTDSLRDALVRIARSPHGSQLPPGPAESFAHAFLADVGPRAVATHPPLETRIAELDPHYDLALLDVMDGGHRPLASRDTPLGIGPMADAFGESCEATAALPATGRGSRRQLPAGLVALLGQPGPAVAVWLATALSSQAPVRARQLPLIVRALGEAGYRQFEVAAHLVRRVPRTQLVALLKQALPALKALDAERRQAVADLVHEIVQVDGRIAVNEYLVGALAAAYLRDDSPAEDAGTRDLIECRVELETLFALIAGREAGNPEVASAAYSAGLSRLLPTAYTPYVTYRGPDWPQVLDQVLASLQELHPAAKQAVAQALEAAVAVEGVVAPEARELVQAVVALLHVSTDETVMPGSTP